MATGTKLKNKTSLNWDQSAQERGGRMMDTGGNYRQIIFDNFSTFFFWHHFIYDFLSKAFISTIQWVMTPLELCTNCINKLCNSEFEPQTGNVKGLCWGCRMALPKISLPNFQLSCKTCLTVLLSEWFFVSWSLKFLSKQFRSFDFFDLAISVSHFLYLNPPRSWLLWRA